MSPSNRPSEADWEQMAKEFLADLFWRPTDGRLLAPGSGERERWDELHLSGRLRAAMIALNPDVPRQYMDQAIAEITAPKSQDALAENYRVHRYLTEGYRGLTYVDHDGQEQTPTLRLIGSQPHENDWLVANQVTIVSGEDERRFDVAVYLNGLPIAVVELRNAGTMHADVASARAQLQTYVREFPLAFRFAAFVVATDGISTRYGTPFTSLNHFAPWNVDDDGRPVRPGDEPADALGTTPLDVAFHGLFNQERFLQLLQHFVAFDQGEAASSSASRRRTSTSPSPRPSAPPSTPSAATARPVWSSTPRGPARRWRWSCRRTASSGTPPCATRPSSSSPTAPSSTGNSSRPSTAAPSCPSRRSRCCAGPTCVPS